MALNAEPADPIARDEKDLPPKSYADALEQNDDDYDGEGDTLIDEDSIKESPPRPTHNRQSSEPRPLGEMIDEADEARTLTSSPSLRHTKGRLEEVDNRETYADAVKEGLPEANGNGDATSEQKHTEGNKTPEVFESTGKDEVPRTPTLRRTHKRASSKDLNGVIKQNDQPGEISPLISPKSLVPDPAVNNHEVVFESLNGKSGDNLASLQPGNGYYLSMEQKENKATSAAPPPKFDGRPQLNSRNRRDSELVSGRRAGANWQRSAIRWAPFNTPLQRRLQTGLVLLHTLSIAGLFALFCLLCSIPLLWPILLPYLIYVLLSRAATDGKLSQRSERLRQSKIWSLFASYFPARLHRTEELQPTRKYIFGYHPHGIISHGAFAAFATEALGFSQLFPGITNTLLTLDSNFRIPLYRDYALRMGLASVSRESCENLLTQGGPNGEGMGRAITIVVGGARESLDGKPGKLRLVLKRRKGFVKLAVRTGADLVPVLSFGENDIYDQLDTEKHPWIHKGQMAVKKFMGFTVPLFHARGVFNYDVGLMPYRRPINVVVGRPIEVQQSANPDPAYVDHLHAQYVDELMRIWEEWKDTFARGRKGELEVVE
ncbi:diacylglycerol O-acyltransferase 1 [Saxophila tyrrhenica]|uniref:diacylglycerol O-acyltransferase n=1 Tax=Saxophila tyrrhenica TaxID=1690608 RepID=A0AAV9PL67_9PEZI|nr:diacylglycerol O-acyltransferase 1 [Saxophila tyrrhenica]